MLQGSFTYCFYRFYQLHLIDLGIGRKFSWVHLQQGGYLLVLIAKLRLRKKNIFRISSIPTIINNCKPYYKVINCFKWCVKQIYRISIYLDDRQQNYGWIQHCWQVAGDVGIPLRFISFSCLVNLLRKSGLASCQMSVQALSAIELDLIHTLV